MSGRSPAPLQDFCNRLERVLRRGAPRGLDFAVELKPGKRGRPLMLRPFLVPGGRGWGKKGLRFREALGMGTISTLAGAPLRQVLARTMKGVPQAAASGRIKRAGAYFMVIEACRHASVLLSQMGAGKEAEVPMELGGVPADLDGRFGECMSSAMRMESVIWRLADLCVGALFRIPVPTLFDAPPRFVHFDATGATILVRWIADDPDDTVLWTESLEEFAATVFGVGRCAEELTDAVERSAVNPDRFDRVARAALEAVSPRLTRAVDTALGRGRSVAVRLAEGHVPNRPGIPMSVWLQIDPERVSEERVPEVTIIVNRGHEEFILEDREASGYYYFPPCVLSAKITVRKGGLAVNYLPTVLVPGGGPFWDHPYTGDLTQSPFTRAETLDGREKDFAFRQPSKEAMRRFSQFSRRYLSAHERSLCLDGQADLVRRLVHRFGGANGREPDALRMATGLHDIVRLGITRGHAGNTSTPRTYLRDTPYPAPGSGPPAWLRHRTFRYDLPKPASAFP